MWARSIQHRGRQQPQKQLLPGALRTCHPFHILRSCGGQLTESGGIYGSRSISAGYSGRCSLLGHGRQSRSGPSIPLPCAPHDHGVCGRDLAGGATANRSWLLIWATWSWQRRFLTAVSSAGTWSYRSPGDYSLTSGSISPPSQIGDIPAHPTGDSSCGSMIPRQQQRRGMRQQRTSSSGYTPCPAREM